MATINKFNRNAFVKVIVESVRLKDGALEFDTPAGGSVCFELHKEGAYFFRNFTKKAYSLKDVNALWDASDWAFFEGVLKGFKGIWTVCLWDEQIVGWLKNERNDVSHDELYSLVEEKFDVGSTRYYEWGLTIWSPIVIEDSIEIGLQTHNGHSGQSSLNFKKYIKAGKLSAVIEIAKNRHQSNVGLTIAAIEAAEFDLDLSTAIDVAALLDEAKVSGDKADYISLRLRGKNIGEALSELGMIASDRGYGGPAEKIFGLIVATLA